MSRLFRLAGLALFAFVASCGSSSDPSPSDGGNTGGTGGTGGGDGQTFTVTVDNNNFSPASLTVPAGSTVTWSWTSRAAGHNVVPDDGNTPARSGSLASGPHTYSFTFGTAGSFRYFCSAHGGPGGSGMSGTVVVQ